MTYVSDPWDGKEENKEEMDCVGKIGNRTHRAHSGF